MATCKRSNAKNFGLTGPCYFLSRYQLPGVTIEDQRMVTIVGAAYRLTLSGVPVTGQILRTTITVRLEDVTELYLPAEYEVQSGDTVDDVIAGLAAALAVYTGAFVIIQTSLSATRARLSVYLTNPHLSEGWIIPSGNTEFMSVQTQCYGFEEVIPARHDLTLSWYPATDNWMFFHDYAPNIYFRDKIDAFCIDSATFYRMNRGPRGLYTTATRKPFIIDLVFRWDQEVIVDHVLWESAIKNSPFQSFSHITVSTREFSTGRVPLDQRRVQGVFAFNKLRDVVITLPFKDDVYNDFNIMSAAIDPNSAWFKRGLLEDNYCIVRLEYDGSDNIVFLGAETQQQLAYR